MPKAQKAKPVAKAVHPYSRKAAQLAREAHKQDKKEKLKTVKAVKLNLIGQKLDWFKKNLDGDKAQYTKTEMCAVIERYLDRFAVELEQIDLVNSVAGRQGRQHGPRETAIRQTLQRERELYDGTGLEVPDVINGKNLRVFREWDGDLKGLPNLKMRKVSSKDATATEKQEQAAENSDKDDTDEMEGNTSP
ncbi:translation machinery-associated protein 16 [Lampetra fluviatilis]